MSNSDSDQEKARLEAEFNIGRQIAFASGLFQGDVTIRTLLESLAEGVVIIDNSGTILLVNAYAEQMFGYPNGDLVGKPHAVLIPERFRKVHEEHQANFFAGPRIRPMGLLLDLAGLRRDGSELPLEICLSFLETVNGVLVLAFISDITLRKELETRLRESEELFHIQVECVKDYAIYMVDTNGIILNWNTGAERFTGYRGEEIIGKRFSCFYSEKDRDEGKPEEELKRAATEGQFAEERWRIRKDGSGFWADVILTPLRDASGNLWGFSKVTHDISERKKAQEALQESEERFRLLADTAPVMIWETGPDARYTFLNRSWLEFTDRNLEQELGEVCDGWTQGVHPDDRERCLDSYLSAFRDRRSFSMEYRLDRGDGEYAWVVSTGVPRLALNGDLLGYIGTCFDITERKRAKEALQQDKELLAQRVAERTSELDTIIERIHDEINERIRMAQALQVETTERLNIQAELREKELLLLHQSRLAAMGDMIGNIAHQWRQPLNMLGLLAQDLLMTHKAGDFNTEYLEANIKKVLETIGHMSQTIDDFRYFFRPDREKTDFRILAMIEKTISLLEGSLKAEQITTTVVPAGDPVVNGYPNEFCQVLLNIIINARDAFVTQKEPSPTITIEIGTEDGRSVVTITDNAGGIPEDTLNKIFEPYFTTKGPDKGTGIGLYMSKIIIEKNMGGTLSARNVGSGAQFRIAV